MLHTKLFAALLLIASVTGARAEGAIAVDDSTGSKPSDAGYGIGFGDSKESAKKAAMAKCQSSGNDACRVAVWFEKCGAYASSAEHFGIGWGASEEAAKDKALDSCGGSDHCRVVASDCED